MPSYNEIIEAEITSLKGLVNEYEQKAEELLQQRSRLNVIIDVLSGKTGDEQLEFNLKDSPKSEDVQDEPGEDSGS